MAEIVIVTGEGLVGHIHLDYLARSPRRRLYINGSEGSLEYDFITGKLEIFTAGDGLTQKKQYRTKRNILYRNQLQHFFDLLTALSFSNHLKPPANRQEAGMVDLIFLVNEFFVCVR